MTFNSSIKELDELGERFHSWKQNNPYRHVPKGYWDEALEFTTKYSLDDVAKAIGYTSSYILYKKQKKQPTATHKMEFVQIRPSQIVSDLNQIQMNIQNIQGVSVELSFQGCVEQVFPLISSLFKERPCSK